MPSEAFILGYRQARHDPETIENNCFQSLSEVPAIVARIVDSKPSVIVMVGSVAALRFAKEATSTIPIVFYDVTDPVSEGVVSSLGRPGGNITGLVNMSEEMHGKRMELLKDALPNITRVGLLGNLTNPSQANYLRALQQAARLLRLETKEYTVELPADIPLAFQAMVRDRIQAMVLLPDSWFFPYRQDLLSLARAHRLPAMYANSTYPDLGGLFAYGASLTDMAFRGAGYVDRILKGARPIDIPIQ